MISPGSREKARGVYRTMKARMMTATIKAPRSMSLDMDEPPRVVDNLSPLQGLQKVVLLRTHHEP
jgi:hypothetical protein